MPDVSLVCPTCPQTFPAPVVNGVTLISPQTLSLIQATDGARWVPICPDCARDILGGAVAVSTV